MLDVAFQLLEDVKAQRQSERAAQDLEAARRRAAIRLVPRPTLGLEHLFFKHGDES